VNASSSSTAPPARSSRPSASSSLVDRQLRQLERAGLAVERPLLVAEEGSHERGLAAREDIRRSLAVMLDHRPQQTVESVIRNEQILELVEADDREPTIGLGESERDIEQLEQH
jgi:hypothetical protein